VFNNWVHAALQLAREKQQFEKLSPVLVFNMQRNPQVRGSTRKVCVIVTGLGINASWCPDSAAGVTAWIPYPGLHFNCTTSGSGIS